MKKMNVLSALVCVAVVLASCNQKTETEDAASTEENLETTVGDEADLSTAHEKAIEITALPSSVTSKIQSDYPGAELIEADEISQEDGAKSYDVEIKADGKTIEVKYDEKGTFLGVESDDADQKGETEPEKE